jgi:hypothetical protein
MNLNSCFVSFGSEYFLDYHCFSCVFPSVLGNTFCTQTQQWI